MTITLSYDPPAEVIAGDSIEFLCRVPSDYTSWTGSARLTGPSVMDASSCVVESDALHITFTGQGTSGTKNLSAGQYFLTVWMTSGNDRKTIAQFPITINQDLSSGSPQQPFCVRMLALIERAIEARVSGNADGGVESYALDGVQVNKLSMEQLEAKRNKYAAEVARLNSSGAIPRLKVAFTHAGSVPDLRRRFIQ